MTLIACEIPEDVADLPRWLERQLMGTHLAELVAELLAVHGSSQTGPPVQSLLGSRFTAVLSNGLSSLPSDTLRQLLLRPALLLELQELVLVAGGSYWDQVSRADAEINDLATRSRPVLEQETPARPQPVARPILLFRKPAAWLRRPLVASLATAALVLLTVFGYQSVRQPVVSPAWGWNRPGALAEGVPPAVYLNRLAEGAGEWFKQRPETAAGIAGRIVEFRQGCTGLIFAAHQPLAPEDRRWLVEKCRDWAKQLDQQLEALEAGKDALAVRDETDATITKLTQALRTRAQQRAAG